MKTDDLIKLLASSAEPVDTHAAARRYAIAVGSGMLGAALLMALLLGVNPRLPAEMLLPMFWVKVAFAAVMVIVSLFAAARLSKPGEPTTGLPAALAAPVVAVWVLAAVVLIGATPAQRVELVMGETWRVCPIYIAILAVPAFCATLWAMRGLAPTRLRLAGAAAGLLSGAIGMLVFTFYCGELAAPFIATWYVIGMLIPAAAGAMLGPRVLRW